MSSRKPNYMSSGTLNKSRPEAGLHVFQETGLHVFWATGLHIFQEIGLHVFPKTGFKISWGDVYLNIIMLDILMAKSH